MTYPFPHAFDPDRYSPAYLRTGIREDAVQALIVAQLRHLGVIAYAVDVGAKALRGRAYGALRRAGLSAAPLNGRTGAGMKGLPDVHGCLPNGRALYIEVKAPAWFVESEKTGRLILKREAGAPTEEQLAFLNAAHKSNAIVGVAWSAADARLIYETQYDRRAA